MNKTALPEAQNWNNYWRLEKTKQFTQVSWSKRRIIQVLSPYLIKGKKALDAGCGSGFFSRYFLDCGMNVAALDYSDSALQLANQATEGRAALLKKDLLRDILKDQVKERFDLIFTDGLFEHFSTTDQDVIFQNLTSVLNPDGVMVTFVPNRFSPWELIRPLYMPGIEEDPFTLSQLKFLNLRNGFKIMEQGGINTFPFAFSPDKFFGPVFGMLLYTISKK